MVMVVRYDAKYNNKLIKCAEFSSLTEQLAYIDDFITNNTFGTAKEVNKTDNFFGKHNLSQSIDGMLYGFDENTQYFSKVMSKMKSKTSNSDGIYLDYEGFAYDMGSVVSGEPECCLNTGEAKSIPCVKIMVDIAWSWSVTAEKIYNRGIAITNLINTLLINGCIVDLYVFRYNIQDDMDILFTTKIDTKILSISAIAFICSPEYFRKIGWITTDKIRNKKSANHRGNSTATKFLLDKIKRDKIFFIGGDYTLPSIINHLTTVEHVNVFILKMFKEFCEENKINISFGED